MKLNTQAVYKGPLTNTGVMTEKTSAEHQLERTIMTCMLWENNFYEDGVSIADRIKDLVPEVNSLAVCSLALKARNEMKLRHVPLLVVREMARHPLHRKYVESLLPEIIQRPDEITEFMAIYWKDGKTPIAKCVKKGLSAAFNKFNEYSFSKYNRDSVIRLRDVMFMVHAKPKDATVKYTKEHRLANSRTEPLTETEVLFKKIVDNTLETANTWETRLSAGEDKAETFRDLMSKRQLGALAFLRNLRNMKEAGIADSELQDYLKDLPVEKVLPFRFISAAKYAPHLESDLEASMFKCLDNKDHLNGEVYMLVDVSYSMLEAVSKKSDITRLEAACGVAMLLKQITDKLKVYTFSEKLIEVPSRNGFALKDSIINSQRHSGTYMVESIRELNQHLDKSDENRKLIIITDEQYNGRKDLNHKDFDDYSTVYVINVASYQYGVGLHNQVTTISGWSDAVIDYILYLENEKSNTVE